MSQQIIRPNRTQSATIFSDSCPNRIYDKYFFHRRYLTVQISVKTMKSFDRKYLCRMMKVGKNIRHLSLHELEEYFAGMGEKSFRAKQVYEWIWQKAALSFADMTNLSKTLRQQLGADFTLT